MYVDDSRAKKTVSCYSLIGFYYTDIMFVIKCKVKKYPPSLSFHSITPLMGCSSFLISGVFGSPNAYIIHPRCHVFITFQFKVKVEAKFVPIPSDYVHAQHPHPASFHSEKSSSLSSATTQWANNKQNKW